jgi:hypothetical protein
MSVVSWILCAAVAGSANPPIEIWGATTCPAPADVEAALPGLIERSDQTPIADVVELTPDGDSVLLTLRGASRESLGEKRLDAALSCDERARAAAVVIAAWEAKLDPQAGALVVPPSPAGAAPAAVEQTQMPPIDMPPPPTRVETGVSVAGSINGTTLAPAAIIEVAVARPFASLIPTVAGLFVGSHSMPVGPGDGTWRRFGLVATVGSRRNLPPVYVEARGGGALTWLDISGSSYPLNASGVTFDPGLTIGVRGGLRLAHFHWWLDAAAMFWPRGQEVYVGGSPGSALLPRAEALLGLGASYAIF